MKCLNQVKEIMVESPIGEMVIKYCQKGLHSMSQVSTITDENFVPKPNQEVTLIKGVPDEKHSKDAINWLSTYFNNSKSLKNCKIPLLCDHVMCKNGSFREKACLILMENVNFGKVVSYKELAELVNNPKAVRAVGSAMSNNPFQLLVPCHRVIPSSKKNGASKTGNYSGGCKNKVKQWLLQHEGFLIKDGKLH